MQPDDERLRQLASDLLAPPGRVEQGDLAAALGHLLKEATNALRASCAMLCLGGERPAQAQLVLTLGTITAEPHLGTLPPYAQHSEPWPGVQATEGPPPSVLLEIAEAGALLLGGRGPGADAPLPEDFPPVGPRIGCPVPGTESAGGALFLARATDAPEFEPTDAAILASLAALIALRVERIRLRRRTAAHEQREAALAALADTCMSAGTLHEVMDAACDHIHRVLEADGTQLWMLEHPRRALQLRTVRGIPGSAHVQQIPLDRTDTIAGRTLRRGEVLHLTDAEEIREGLVDPAARDAGYTTASAFPLIAHDRTYGALIVYFRRMAVLGHDGERFVKNVADLLAVATANYEAQDERALSDAVFRTALANSPVPLIVYDEGGRIVGASRRAWESLGLRRTAIRDIDDWFERAFPEPAYRETIRRRVEDPDRRAGRPGNVGDAEVTCSDGSVRVWTVMHDVVEHANHPTMHFLAALDVTEERQAQADLRQATKMEAVGRLAGGIAHDFNNLLTVISGYVDIAMMRIGPDHPARKSVAEIALASEKASQVTEKLLAFSRQRKPEPRSLDMNSVITNLMSMVRRVIGEGITCTLDLGHGVPAVQIDHGSFEQTLLNLFVNARDAMNGAGTIRVRTLHLQHGEVPPVVGGPAVSGPHAVLLIEDDGCGMSSEVLGRIFEPFFTTKSPGVGTGLGLAGAYASLTQAGGDIRVHSVEGQGTTFGILLPGVPGLATRPEANEATAAPRGTETILVAEDREQVRDLAKTILASLGYTVLTASNGEDALAVAEAHTGPIHLLLTDVIMPRMGGVELAAAIAERIEGIPVVYMSGYPGKDLSETLPTHGERSVLRKPFTSTALGQRVREALDEVS